MSDPDSRTSCPTNIQLRREVFPYGKVLVLLLILDNQTLFVG